MARRPREGAPKQAPHGPVPSGERRTAHASEDGGPRAADGRRRAVIEGVQPEIDGGRFPIKRTVGETVVVEADIFTDGHDALACRLLHRAPSAADWTEVPMASLGNDRWRAEFPVAEIGTHLYTLKAWVDPFAGWSEGLFKKLEAGRLEEADLLAGAALLEGAAGRASGHDAQRLRALAERLRSDGSLEERAGLALAPEAAALAGAYPDRSLETGYPRTLSVRVDREKARFSAWYEMFPRSASREPGRHGTFRDVIARLPYVAGMGFDVLYLPPIHPIGRTHRKGPNNALKAGSADPGSPWAIGGPEGGHKAVHPELGTLEDFDALVAAAGRHGLEIALDVAFQCSPDHPYLREHPEWFRKRPDGSIQYAENPPKKYEDIVPFDFECADWRGLWEELKSVFLFWARRGVRIFRVDNPHTKPFAFWEWVIPEVQRAHPETIFLSEAFTRPKVMYRLAKLGFTQSYNYFPWRNTAWDLAQYFTEITRPPVRDFFRASLWPNTPDILTEFHQFGGPPAFRVRLVLAATLGASYGIYGPAFELCEARAREPGSEEYLDSEKYQLRSWDIGRADSLSGLIARVNRIRRENPALQSDRSLRFHPVDNGQLLCYSKADGDNVILTAVNTDPRYVQSGWLELSPGELGLPEDAPFQAHDLLTGARYLWQGRRHFIQLDPHTAPAHILRLRRRARSERDFDYFM